jgi:hypothetical protein
MRRSTLLPWLMVGTLIGFVGCGAPGGVGELEPEDLVEDVDDGKYEAWNSANNPAYVDNSFVYEVDQLPPQGETATPPWSGDYWATYKDSLNIKWDGADSLSPAQKVEAALGKAGFPKAITDNYGIYGHGRKSCNETSECSDLKDGSQCVKPAGAEGDKAGRCIPTWWGICHGWAPAAIAEPAPVRPVEKNGVTFYPGDLEGLMSLAYGENLPVKFLSQRCNKRPDDVRTGSTGRIEDSPCRDCNPGSFHIVATNMLGLRKKGFVEDRTYSDEVWNQPVRGYKITNAENGKLKEITKEQAMALLGLNLHFDTLLAEVEIKKNDKQSGVYNVERDGEVIVKLSGTGDGDLHVKLNAEATESAYDCRPYAGNSTEECRVTAKAGDKVHFMVLGYAESSKVKVDVGGASGAANYTYNAKAERFYHVELDLRWITESHPARMSHINQIDSYTRTDHYSYILEADAAGRVIGGEWMGDSLKNHPDFLWWPTGAPSGTLAGGLTYREVKALFNQAAGGGASEGETRELLKDVALGRSSKYVTLGVDGGKTVTLKLSGTGNADLYVKRGRKPTVNSFLHKSTGPTSDETITFKAPADGGTYYVRVRPMSNDAKVTLTATIRD